LAEVGRQLGVSRTYVERLSSRYGWVRRAAAFDQEEFRRRQASRARRIEEMNDRQALIAMAVLCKVAERVAGLDPDSIRVADIPRLLAIAAATERSALGVMPDPVVCVPQPQFDAQRIRELLKADGILRDLQAHRHRDD
jgi:hypothetical protein